jgi:uncharacterized protein (DUF433 family)
MTKQAIDWSGCDLVEVIPGKVSGAPLLKGTRLPVSAITENAADGLSAAEISDLFDAPEDQVRAIMDYAARQQRAKPQRRRGLSPVGS